MSENQTILVADDSESDFMLLRVAFQKAAFKNPLQSVCNGEEAISYLQGAGVYGDRSRYPLPAVILLDLNMPLKNGFDVLTWMRTQAALKHVSVVVLSASTRMEDVERAFDLGASSYLAKPSTLDGLTDMIRCLRDWLRINHFPPHNQVVRR